MVKMKWLKGVLLGLALALGAAPALVYSAAATVAISPLAKQRFFDANGVPLAGGQLFTYAAGTTIKQTTYTDSTGATPNTNPVVLDSAGYANVWVVTTQSYKFTLSPSTDTDPPSNPIWTVDNLSSVITPLNWATGGGSSDAITATYTPANTSLFDGLLLGVRATAANATTTPTFSPDSLTAHPITKLGGSPLQIGDIHGALSEILLRYNLANTRWELLNPAQQSLPWVVAGGTADALTGTYIPANTTLTDGLLLTVRATAANATTTPTFAPDGLTAHTITKLGGLPLVAGDIQRAGFELILRYNLSNTRWELLNPIVSKQPTRTVLTAGSGTYTTPTGVTHINVRVVGGGAGGGAAITNNGTSGNSTTFGTLTGSGGVAGQAGGVFAGNNGGAGSGGDINIQGGAGVSGSINTAATVSPAGGMGGISAFGGAGAGGAAASTGTNASANSGSGGGGGGAAAGTASGGGGGAGGYTEKLFSPPSATYSYGVAAAVSGGTAGGANGGNGASGLIIVDEFYN